MILRSEELKDICSKILPAVDNDGTTASETLQLVANNNEFSISVTNGEYFVTVRTNLDETESLCATVNAGTFLKLISQITTDTIELVVKGNTLLVKGNGSYRLPMIYENDSLLQLRPITIENVTTEMEISGEILESILQFNSKELLRGKDLVVRPAQKYYYLDENGAITWTAGACVNNFSLSKPVKILLSNKVVKLFKLLGENAVKFVLGHDALSEDIVQTKVRFSTNSVTISAILSCDDSLVLSVPAKAIRERANHTHNYSAVFNKDELSRSLNRFMLFVDKNNRDPMKTCGVLTFDEYGVEIKGNNYDFDETVLYSGMTNNVDSKYTATLDLVDLKTCLDTAAGAYITLNFGDHEAFVLSNGNIKNLISEISEDE